MDTTGLWETLNEESISLGKLKQWQAPFSVVAGYIEMLDQKLFREFDMGLQVVDLLELLDAQAALKGVELNTLYDQLPKRYQTLLGSRDIERTYRMELIELLAGDMDRYPNISFSPNEWHGLVKAHPDWAAKVPTAICQTEAFYYPLVDLLAAREELKQRVPDGFYDRPQFQTEAIVSGFVSIEEIGNRLLPDNAPYVTVSQYGSLTNEQRSLPAFQSLAYGAVLYDVKNVLKVPSAYLTDVMIRHAACADFGLLAQLPYGRVLACPMTDELLCMAVRDQVKCKEDVTRLKRTIPFCYQTHTVLSQLNHIARLYGVEDSSFQRQVQQQRGVHY